jgi:hypothetical protein
MNPQTEAAIRAVCGADPGVAPSAIDEALAVLGRCGASPLGYIPLDDRIPESVAARIMGASAPTLCRMRATGRVPAGNRWMSGAAGLIKWSRRDCIAWASRNTKGTP